MYTSDALIKKIHIMQKEGVAVSITKSAVLFARTLFPENEAIMVYWILSL